tara:strand:+ start:210 stop:431 length:222 start_codon:yes stop_codon:yes gene_type:complete
MIKSAIKKIMSTAKNKLISKYLTQDTNNIVKKSTDINILLNRVKLNKKNESRKKIVFSAVASVSVVLFGILVF